jgi:hypothetical protein
MLSIAAAVMTWAATALADSPQLKGAYAANGTTTCISAMAFGDPPTYLAESFGTNQWTAVQGIRTFNGDGTGSAHFILMGVTRPMPLAPPPPYPQGYFGEGFSTDLKWSFTYTVDGNGIWTSDAVPGSVVAVGITGSRHGQTWTISNFPTFTGYISTNASTLTAATLAPTVETLHYSNGPSPRICARQEVLTNLSNNQGGNSQGDN